MVIECSDMSGKTCLVTGATSGIGKECALSLAGAGAEVVLIARDPGRGMATRQEIAAAFPSASTDLLIADLASMRKVRRLAEEFSDRHDRLDVLINNAGVTLGGRSLTEDGIETVWAVNHFAPFLLTRELKPMLSGAPDARVVTVASDAHHRARLDLNKLEDGHYSSGWRAYCDSKLANILFTRELARRLASDGIVANCLHPGVVATGFGYSGPLHIRLFFKFARSRLLTAEQGAETLVYVASSDEGGQVTGGYFQKCRQATPSTMARDDDAARRLWEISERVIGA